MQKNTEFVFGGRVGCVTSIKKQILKYLFISIFIDFAFKKLQANCKKDLQEIGSKHK